MEIYKLIILNTGKVYQKGSVIDTIDGEQIIVDNILQYEGEPDYCDVSTNEEEPITRLNVYQINGRTKNISISVFVPFESAMCFYMENYND